MIRVLFVCLGNICRSPMAEGAFRKVVENSGLESSFEIDSAGTSGYHIGEPADKRMREVAFENGITLTSRSRQITIDDLDYYHYILAMDSANFGDIISLKQNFSAKVLMMRKFDNQYPDTDVPDPYYGGLQGFQNVYDMLIRSNEEFLTYIRQEHGI